MSIHGRTREDLSGLAFGRLTVIRKAENINGRTAWLCRCSCGNEKTVITKYLKNGAVRSCGCLKKEQLKSKAKDYTGQRFGMLTVLSPTEHRDKSGSIVWLCRCDCGNTVEVSQAGLVSGNNTSCGCTWENNKRHINDRLKAENGTSVVLLKNRRYRKDNKSGFRGVTKTADNKYRVFIGFKRKKYSLGIYENITDAIEKRLEAEHLLFDGYIRTKNNWHNKEPLIFEVNKNKNILTVTSNNPLIDGKSLICCTEKPIINNPKHYSSAKTKKKKVCR